MNKIFQSLVVVLLVSLSLSPLLVTHAEATENSWTTKAPMPTARAGHRVAVVNGKTYAIGGYNGSVYVNTNEEYDPATDTWATRTPMPTARAEFGIAVYQNKIYVIGGSTGWSSSTGTILTGVNEVYDPLTDTWETKTPMPTNRTRLCANVVNGKIYLIGGLHFQSGSPYPVYLDVNEVYDPSTDSWTTKAPLPTAVDGYSSAVVNNKIYVISGFNCKLNQIYDAETNTWSYGAPIPTDITRAAAGATTGVLAPKRIYVISGRPSKSLDPCDLNQVYDPVKDVWTTGAPILTPRDGLAVAVVNDKLYAIGGSTGFLRPLTANNEQYTPSGFGTAPPTISIVSPENKTYTVNNVSLTFTVSEPTSWIGYSLDEQANVTITGNTTLTGLFDGTHSLIVYAKDTAGNTGASETIYFTAIPLPPKNGPSGLLPRWAAWAVAVSVMIVAVIGAALLIYFGKIRKTTGKAEK